MTVIKKQAPGKINLGLDVVRRMENGYHEVRMIMQTVGICDELTFQVKQVPGILIQTDTKEIPCDERNLVYKAAKLMIEHYQIEEGVYITLKKVIPVAAGMAGGSADAAATFLGLNELFQLGLTKEELMHHAVGLGADIPYCILGGTALAEGIGERLTPIPDAPDCVVLIAKPDIYVSTQHVYQNLQVDSLYSHPKIDKIVNAIMRNDIKGMCAFMGNVLESVTEKEHVVISELKRIMEYQGAMSAMMSGSGPSVFGLFEREEDAMAARLVIEKQNLAKQLFITNFQR